ncbi:hypothetical protein [uncultured Formosa sp.]|uniref:hypothetical protein n=1 Tax=uncultured Formosa sp. TaxID=255435 RepID=UPI00260F3B66|nr:hypothetical protein [uncultured Formosa sp.]
MKKVLFFTGLLFLGLSAKARTINPVLVNVGDVVTIGAPSNFEYSSIKFPRKNFIMKRGGIVNHKSLAGVKVEVVRVEKRRDGSREAIIKRADGRKFFNVLPTVIIELEHAVDTKELLLHTNSVFVI